MAKKTRATITGVKEVRDEYLAFLRKEVKEEAALKFIGNEMITQIKNRTRARMEDYKQPELKPSTQDRRKKLIAVGNKGYPFVQPKRSNLTLSGQLLDAIQFKFNRFTQTITAYLLEGRIPYTGVSGKELENKTNLDIKRDLEKRGFRFLFISDALLTTLEDRFAKYMQRRLSLYKRIRRKLSR